MGEESDGMGRGLDQIGKLQENISFAASTLVQMWACDDAAFLNICFGKVLVLIRATAAALQPS